jgi:hypothetical protein
MDSTLDVEDLSGEESVSRDLDLGRSLRLFRSSTPRKYIDACWAETYRPPWLPWIPNHDVSPVHHDETLFEGDVRAVRTVFDHLSAEAASWLVTRFAILRGSAVRCT